MLASTGFSASGSHVYTLLALPAVAVASVECICFVWPYTLLGTTDRNRQGQPVHRLASDLTQDGLA